MMYPEKQRRRSEVKVTVSKGLCLHPNNINILNANDKKTDQYVLI